MQTLTLASPMNRRNSQLNTLDAFALRKFVLGLVEELEKPVAGALPWKTREEGLALIEEILLEGRACGIDTRQGIEELCRMILALQVRPPFSEQVRQALRRPGLSELQRIEGLRLSLTSTRREASLMSLPHASRN